jgi:hypothetical protein
MRMLRRQAAAAALIGGSMLAGGALGAVVFVPHLAGAQTTPSTQTPSPSNGSGTLGSNEDPAHEANETPQQEADENAGRGHSGCHHGRNSGQSGTTAPGPSSQSY